MSSEETQLRTAPSPPRFLQRWAYWILGVVVLVGFINALFPDLILNVVYGIIRFRWSEHSFFSRVEPRGPIERGQMEFDNQVLEQRFEVFIEYHERNGIKLIYEAERFDRTLDDYIITAKALNSKVPLQLSLDAKKQPDGRFIVHQIWFAGDSADCSFRWRTQGVDRADIHFYFRPPRDPDYVKTIDRSKEGPSFHYDHKCTMISDYVAYKGYEYAIGISTSPTTTSANYLPCFDSPEAFLKIALAEEDAHEQIARQNYATSLATIINGHGLKMDGSFQPQPVADLTPQEQAELFDVILNKIESRREYLRQHYVEMQENLCLAFPIWDAIFKLPPASEAAK